MNKFIYVFLLFTFPCGLYSQHDSISTQEILALQLTLIDDARTTNIGQQLDDFPFMRIGWHQALTYKRDVIQLDETLPTRAGDLLTEPPYYYWLTPNDKFVKLANSSTQRKTIWRLAFFKPYHQNYNPSLLGLTYGGSVEAIAQDAAMRGFSTPFIPIATLVEWSAVDLLTAYPLKGSYIYVGLRTSPVSQTFASYAYDVASLGLSYNPYIFLNKLDLIAIAIGRTFLNVNRQLYVGIYW